MDVAVESRVAPDRIGLVRKAKAYIALTKPRVVALLLVTTVPTMILAATIAGMRARAIPGWAGWLSIVAGVVSLALVIFFPWFVLAVWVLVVSIGLFVRAGRTPAVS